MRMRILLAAILLALALSAAADADPPAQQQQCGPLEKIQEVLKAEYGESPAAIMESEQGTPILIFSNLATATFTVIAMRSGDTGCVVMSGDNFHIIPQKPAKPADAPS